MAKSKSGISKSRTSKSAENNDYIYITVLALFSTLTLGTFFHDPLLHGLIAWINGWQIGEYNSGLMTGQTTVIATAAQAAHASTFSFWLFFMFPAIAIYFMSFAAIIINPDRLIIVIGRILMALNLASLNPQIPGSDASNAITFLMTRGWTEFGAYAVHFIILGVMVILWGLFEYIGTENNPEDAKKRAANIFE